MVVFKCSNKAVLDVVGIVEGSTMLDMMRRCYMRLCG